MSGIWPYIVVPLVIGFVALIVWHSLASERAFHREWKLRHPMDDLTFYESFYESTGVPVDIPRRLRPIYGKFFGIDATRLRPTDRPPEIVDIDTVGLVRDIEAEFDVTIPDADAENMDGSFDSIVRYLAAQRPPTNALGHGSTSN